MRKRDADLYYLRKRGYQRVATWDDLEVWVMPGNPEDFRVIRACPELSPEMRDALIDEFERMETEMGPPGTNPNGI